MTFQPEQIEALKAPLERSHVKDRTQSGRKLSYIEGWWAIAEANRIFGHDAWTRETIRLEETNRDLVTLRGDRGEYQQWRVGYLAVVKITVFAGDTLVVRHGTGFGSGMSKPEALSEAIESAAKEAETDAMKRALMTFGNPFGLALYDKTQENVSNAPTNGNGTRPKSSAQNKREGAWDEFQNDLAGVETVVALNRLWADYEEKVYPNWSESWKAQAHEAFEKRRDELEDGVISDPVPPPNGETRTIPASKQNQGRQRMPGPRLPPKESEALGKMLISAMKFAKSQEELDAWKASEASKINSLIDEHYWSLVLEGQMLRKKLPAKLVALEDAVQLEGAE